MGGVTFSGFPQSLKTAVEAPPPLVTASTGRGEPVVDMYSVPVNSPGSSPRRPSTDCPLITVGVSFETDPEGVTCCKSDPSVRVCAIPLKAWSSEEKDSHFPPHS